MSPGHRGVRFDGEEQFLPLSGVRRSEAHLEVEIVPADDGVFDEAVARLGDLLVVLVGIGEFPRIADGDGARETIGQLHRSEEHTSELQSLMRISYAVFCLKKKKYSYIKIDIYTLFT